MQLYSKTLPKQI